MGMRNFDSTFPDFKQLYGLASKLVEWTYGTTDQCGCFSLFNAARCVLSVQFSSFLTCLAVSTA